VNGITNSIFGQFSFCNGAAFFAAAQTAVLNGQLVPPPLGTALDGQPCPTVRDFSVVDQDQSDNVITKYLIIGNNSISDTTANRKKYPNAIVAANGSDNLLLTAFIYPALGCTPYTAPDLADPGVPKSSLPLNELQAMVYQQAPIALVPAGDPMVVDNGNENLLKLNRYRTGVNQPAVLSFSAASTLTYCQNLGKNAALRILLDSTFTSVFASPAPNCATSLFTFLAMRYAATWVNLNCVALLAANPATLTTDLDGVVTNATLTPTADMSPASRSPVWAAFSVAMLVFALIV